MIGVPVKASSLDGLDSLLSIVQMPKGVPVATVGINNAKNAALIALKILGVFDDLIQQKLLDFMTAQKEESRQKTKHLI